MTSTAGAGVVPTCWLVRAGRRGVHVDDVVRLGVITISWASIPGIGDLRELDEDDLLVRLRAAQRGKPRADLRELLEFRDGISVGDAILTPAPATAALLVGIVSGPYDYAPKALVGGHRHFRPVSWQGRVDRDEAPPALAHRLRRYQRTVLRLPEQAEALELVRRF